MKSAVNKILIKRYIKYIILMVIVILGYTTFSSISAVNSWKDLYNYVNSEKATADYQKYVNDIRLDMEENPDDYSSDYQIETEKEYFNGYLWTIGMAGFSHSEKDYKNTPTEVTTDNRFVNFISLGCLVSFFIGVLAFFVDYKTNFNQYLFSIGVKRSDIYWKKILFFLVPLVITSILVVLINSSLVFTIPSEYLLISKTDYCLALLGAICKQVFLFSLGAIAGMSLGQIITGIIAVYGLYFSVSIGYLSGTVYEIYMSIRLRGVEINDAVIEKYYIGQNSIFEKYYNQISILYIIVALLLLVIGYFFFKKLTSENMGQFIMINQLKLPVSIVFCLYTPTWFLLTGMFGYGLSAYINPEYFFYGWMDEIPTLSYWQPVVQFLVIFAICAIIAAMVVYGKRPRISFAKGS